MSEKRPSVWARATSFSCGTHKVISCSISKMETLKWLDQNSASRSKNESEQPIVRRRRAIWSFWNIALCFGWVTALSSWNRHEPRPRSSSMKIPSSTGGLLELICSRSHPFGSSPTRAISPGLAPIPKRFKTVRVRGSSMRSSCKAIARIWVRGNDPTSCVRQEETRLEPIETRRKEPVPEAPGSKAPAFGSGESDAMPMEAVGTVGIVGAVEGMDTMKTMETMEGMRDAGRPEAPGAADPRARRAPRRRPDCVYAAPTSFVGATAAQKRLVLRQEPRPASFWMDLLRRIRRASMFWLHWRTLRPFTFKGAVCDVLLVGSNPLLLALALRKAVRERPDASFLVAPVGLEDPWEHGALALSPFRAVAGRALRSAFPSFSDEIDDAGKAAARKASASDWLDAAFQAIGSEIRPSAKGSVRWIDPQSLFGFVPSIHREEGWTPVHLLRGSVFDRMKGEGWPDAKGGMQRTAEAAFLRRILKRFPVLDLPVPDPREFVLLAGSIVAVSSLPGAFAGAESEDQDGRFRKTPFRPDILPIGSAAWRCETKGVGLERALADLLELLDPAIPLLREIPESFGQSKLESQSPIASDP